MFLSAGIRPRSSPQSPAFPLKAASNGRYLVDQVNRPFLVCGDSGWNLPFSVSTTDCSAYCTDRLQRGYNTTLVYFVTTISGGTAATSPANLNGDQPFTKNLDGSTYTGSITTADFTTPNTPYWNNVDSIMTTLANEGMLVFCFADYLGFNGGNQGWYTDFTSCSNAQLQSYGSFIGNRYGGYSNIIWVLGGDYNPPSTNIVDQFAIGLKSADTSHLITAHCNGGSSPPDVYTTTKWWNLNTIYEDVQIGGNEEIYIKSYQQYALSPAIPQVLIESCYEGDNSSTPALIRRQIWSALLAGCCGYFYGGGGSSGAMPLWEFNTNWRTLLNSRGNLDAAIANSFFNRRYWWNLAPDTGNSLVTNGGSYTNANHIGAALSSDGSWACLYVPTTELATVNTSLVTASGALWYWLDPTNGNVQPLGAFSGSHNFTPPTANAQGDPDWVLVAEVPERNVWV